MSRTRHTEAQMIGAPKQLEARRKAEDVTREVGVSKHTIYAWRAKYGGIDVREAQEAERLREENTRLRKLVSDLSLDKEALQSVIRKKQLGLIVRRAAIEQMREEYTFSERRACGLIGVRVSSYRDQPRRSDQPLRTRLMELAREKPRCGYQCLHVLLR